MNYTPFPGLKLDEVSAVDLLKLREVREGWYVEYKRAMPNPAALAKSISAFANTYGGWLFIGVAEQSKETSVAGEFVGLPAQEIDAALQRVRQGIAAHLNPTPYFECKVVEGDSSSELPHDRFVLCIRVPEGHEPPYLHSSGVIFRRVGDGSEPKPEVDRTQLDSLYNKRANKEKEYASWLEAVPEIRQSESTRAYLRILLDGNPYDMMPVRNELTYEKVKRVLGGGGGARGFPFDVIFPTGQGWIARQTSRLPTHDEFGLTWIIRGGKSEVLIPINIFAAEHPRGLHAALRGYNNREKFIKLLISSRCLNVRIADLKQTFLTLEATSSAFLRLLTELGLPRRAACKVQLMNIARVIPFVDSGVVLETFEDFGIPFSLIDNPTVPRGTSGKTFLQFSTDGSGEDEWETSVPCCMNLFSLTMAAFGVQGFHGFGEENTNDALRLTRELINHSTSK